MTISNYYLKARLFPAVLTSFPALIIYNKFVSPLYLDELKNIYKALPTITDIIFSSAIIFLLIQINRFLAKEIFQRFYFKDEIEMPTTDLLLKSNTEFETSIKLKIEDKIKDKFDISLLSQTDESSEEIKARKLIVFAVSQIRNLLRDNVMLLQHNIEYGFIRNLVGGSILAFAFSLAISVCSNFSNDVTTRNLGMILTIIYFLPVLMSKLIIKRYGKYYAKTLYEQFMTI